MKLRRKAVFTDLSRPVFTSLDDPSVVCAIGGCAEPVHARDWCCCHYKRWYKHGDPETVLKSGPARRDPVERFWPKVDKDGPVPAHRPELGPCWLWTAVTRRGYGRFGARDGMVDSHRFAWELAHGAIPDGLVLDHICHNDSGCPGGEDCPHRACVNPAHLEVVTQTENNLRGESPTAHNARKTHCVNGHEFTPENTRILPNGKRLCRACTRLWDRERRSRDRRARVGMNDDLGPLASGVHVTPIRRLALGAIGLTPNFKTNSARDVETSGRMTHEERTLDERAN